MKKIRIEGWEWRRGCWQKTKSWESRVTIYKWIHDIQNDFYEIHYTDNSL